LKFSLRARKYLESRGIYDQTLLDSLNIGYAPERGLYKYMVSKGFSGKELIEEGLIREDLQDFFRDRIMFPVYDRQGNIVTVSSRAVNPNQKIRHLHLKGSISHFYNESALNGHYVVVVEGIFDCLSLLQAGFPAVAVFGTGGLKEELARKLAKIDEVYLCFDKEVNSAGEKGVERALDILKEYKPRGVYTVRLPYLDGKKIDVNDLFSKHGFKKEDFAELLRIAKSKK
jgi:DNA primase